MKYVFFIIVIILSLIICYKIITPYPFPSKYFSPENSKWHFFSKDRNILKSLYTPSFFIKSIHLSGDFNEIKAIEIQSLAPFFIFKFFKLNGFSLIKSNYGACYLKEKGNFFDLTEKNLSFGWINTEPIINLKLRKNKNFEFESFVEKKAEEDYFKLKDGFEIEIYEASSPHFNLLFPKIEDIEIYYKKDVGYLRLKENGKIKEMKFGKYENARSREEKLSFYLKVKNAKFLKKYLKHPIFELVEDIEIKCKSEGNFEKCTGYFSLKNLRFQIQKE